MESMKSIYAFISRELHRISKDKWEEYNSYTWVDGKDKQYNDPKYNWIMCIPETARDTKYGRRMVSEEFKLIRGTTMGEFYGTSTVD